MSKVQMVFSENRMEYETPRGGVTLGGYVALRLHKTSLIQSLPDLLQRDRGRALAQIAIYAAAASTSYGQAKYQPGSDPIGMVIETIDSDTGARVTVTCERNLRFSYRIEMVGIGVISGTETIMGTTVGLRGLGMSAPTTFVFMAERGNYRADLIGVITSELAPRIGTWRIRGFGAMDLSDSTGNRGWLSLDRSGLALVTITTPAGETFEIIEKLA